MSERPVPRIRRDEAGVTMVEIIVASVLLAIVATIMFSVLSSLQRTDRRVHALVSNEQDARFAITELTRDIRSANPSLDQYSSTAADYQTQIEFKLGPQAGPQERVRWVYDVDPSSPDYRTLKRETLDLAGTVLTSTVKLRNLRNVDRGVSLFTFYNYSGTDLVATATSGNDVARCATHVEVVITADSNPGPEPFTVRSDAEIRNQLPGGPGCI